MLLHLAAMLAVAQTPGQADTLSRDTVRLKPLEVSVTRSGRSAWTVPAPVSVLDSSDFRRARLLGGIDEVLGQMPGLVVANRYNPSLDQRLVIRGAGSRASFGVRGIKLLIDGLPQTLPDGQSQLSNLDLNIVSRVEALTGSASALYGNAAGGVVSFSTEFPTGSGFARGRVASGGFGTTRLSAAVGAARGGLSGLVAVTDARADGYRQHSRAESRQLTIAGTAVLSPTWLLRTRYFLTDSPRAENPGALTSAEVMVGPDGAAPNNVLRGADKSVTQHQLGFTVSHASTDSRFELAIFGLTRDLVNPLAVPPPGPRSPTTGTFNAIDRIAGGSRLTFERAVRRGVRIGGGVEFQTMRDHRLNLRSDGGEPTHTVVVDQRETATEIGPFVTLRLQPSARWLVSGALRYDRLRFATTDRYLADGDRSGSRAMGAVSGSVGLSYAADNQVVWGAVSSAFDTPTTTELANRPDGGAGFNDRLGPQRAATVEVGVRHDGPVRGSLTVYRTVVRNAIVQAREESGRAYFENAGRLRHHGIEAALDAGHGWLRGRLAYTMTGSRFLEYRRRVGPVVDTLDGKRVPGIPRHVARLGLVVERGAASVEVEQQLVSSQAANDDNSLIADGWGVGVTTLRVAARFALDRRRGLAVAPFAALNNVFDRRYVGSVTVNGFGGRVFEPAPGRWLFLGLEIVGGH